jgi:transaldolase
MKLFIDTANVDEIRRAWEWGVIAGVTTNPSLAAKEKRDFAVVLREITGIVDGPISAEALATDTAGMVAEARQLSAVSPNIVVKIPMTPAGTSAVRQLSREGIKTNVTLVFTANQGLLAALAGATYVSPFVGRLDDISHEGMAAVRDLCEIFAVHDIPAQVIAASIRHPVHVIEAARAGAHAATVPFKVLEQMFRHPLTDAGIARFIEDWRTLRQG